MITGQYGSIYQNVVLAILTVDISLLLKRKAVGTDAHWSAGRGDDSGNKLRCSGPAMQQPGQGSSRDQQGWASACFCNAPTWRVFCWTKKKQVATQYI